jgi:DNA adenine methylase
VKWAGGKTKLLPELLARVPAAWNRYYEPFAGGAALFFRLAAGRAVLGDVNADLIGMYEAIAADAGDVLRGLRRHASAHCEQHYAATRSRWNTQRAAWPPAQRAAAFIYLNKTCFNGLWRVNRKGEFNVPMGRYTAPTIYVPDAIEAAHARLSRAQLRTGDYRLTIDDASRGDLIYFDPPYAPVSETANFTSYTPFPFGRDEQRRLAETARELVARGCHVLVSNSDTPIIHELYRGFRIDRVKCPRSINSAADRRGDVDELIITGLPA